VRGSRAQVTHEIAHGYGVSVSSAVSLLNMEDMASLLHSFVF
jgi:hypothetical protein